MSDINYVRTGRSVLDLGSYGAIRQDRALFDLEQLTAGQGNLTYGWYTGGASVTSVPLSRIDRITFADDTEQASIRGLLTNSREGPSGFGNTTSAWIFGGESRQTNTFFSSIERINFSNDVATAQVRSSLSSSHSLQATTGNATDSWLTGGLNLTTATISALISRVSFANDVIAPTLRANTPTQRAEHCASGNSTDGWFAGGRGTDATLNVSTVHRITFATDDISPQTKSGLNNPRAFAAGTGNATDMWIIGGLINRSSTPLTLTSIERITFAQDTSAVALRGNKTLSLSSFDATGNTTDAWTSGGGQTTIERLTFANDTSTMAVRTVASQSRTNPVAVS